MHAAFMFLLNRFTANLNFNALKLKPKFQTRAIRLTAASEWTVPALLAVSLYDAPLDDVCYGSKRAFASRFASCARMAS